MFLQKPTPLSTSSNRLRRVDDDDINRGQAQTHNFSMEYRAYRPLDQPCLEFKYLNFLLFVPRKDTFSTLKIVAKMSFSLNLDKYLLPLFFEGK